MAKANMGALRPPNPPSGERPAADFWRMPQCTAPFFQKPMIAWGQCYYHGGKPPYPHAPREEFSRIHSDHRLLKRWAQFAMAYAKNPRRGVPRSGGLGDEIPHKKNETLAFWRKRFYAHSSALVAQLDRAFDYESKGREFESLRARHFLLCDL